MIPFYPKNEIILKSVSSFGEWIAEKIIEKGIESINKYGSFSLAFPGGNTPIPVFNALRDKTKSKVINWSKVHVYWIDERFVPLNHNDSNFRLCYEKFLKYNDQINYYPVNTKIDLLRSCANYENQINCNVRIDELGCPVFDLIFLGIGEDGHIASLFPNTKVLEHDSNILVPVYDSPKKHNRISFTLKLLNNSKNRIIGIFGEKKLKIYNDLLNGITNNYPLQNIISSNSKDYWVLYN